MKREGDGGKTFVEFAGENDFIIHKQMNKLGIQDFHGEFFQEGIICLWGVYLDFGDCEDLVFAFANFRMRHRLSVMQHDYPSYRKRQGIFALNASKGSAIFHNLHIQNAIQDRMTLNQWKWTYHHLLLDVGIKRPTAV